MRTPISALTLGLCFAAFTGEAFAQSECEVDADCSAGMVCEVTGVSGCAGSAPCPPDAPDCMPEPVMCESEEFRSCVPGPCESDADCGDGMVCQDVEVRGCSSVGVVCDENGDCKEVEGECEGSGSISQCVYQWQLPCESDSDCGGDFTCVVEEACDCASSGGGSTEPLPAEEDPAGAPLVAPPLVDGGAAPPPPDEEKPVEECTCAEYSYCKAAEIPCESDAECPTDWTCEAPQTVTCDDVATDDGDVAMGGASEPMEGEAAPPADGTEPAAVDAGVSEDPIMRPVEPMCETVEGPSQCVPPGGFVDGVGRPGTDAPTAGGEEGEPQVDTGSDPDDGDDNSVDEDLSEGNEDAGAPPDLEPEEQDDDEPSGDDDEAGDDEDPSDDEEPGQEDDAGVDSELNGQDDSGDSGDDGLCSVGNVGNGVGSAAPAAWLVALFGLMMFRRRRG